MKFLWNKEAIFADELLVKVDLAPAIVRSLDADHIPMDLAAVAVIGPFVSLSGREMKGTGDLFVEENVAHWLPDIGIKPEREFADVPGAFVGIENGVQSLRIIRSGIDHFAVFECRDEPNRTRFPDRPSEH